MKKTLFIIILLASTLFAWAADVIIKRDESKIDAIIEEVSRSDIKYRKVNNPTGPLFVIETSEIAAIIYSNGEVQAFAPNDEATTNTPSSNEVAPSPVSEPQHLVKENTIVNDEATAHSEAYWLYQLEKEKRLREEQEFRQKQEEQRQAERLAKQQEAEARKNEQKQQEEAKKVALQQKKDEQKEHRTQTTKEFIHGLVFQSNVEIAGIVSGGKNNEDTYYRDLGYFYTTSIWGGFGIDGTFGARTSDQIHFLGIGVGFHSLFTKKFFDSCWYMSFKGRGYRFDDNFKGSIGYMPLYVNYRAYLPTNVNINPYLDASFGGFTTLGSNVNGGEGYGEHGIPLKGGLYTRLGVGVDIRRFNVGVGYELIYSPISSDSHIHTAYFKFGYRFGKSYSGDTNMY